MSRLKILRRDELEDLICVVVGTRPGIIKFSPIIKELIERKKNFFIIHTGQHYSYNMDRLFFEELELPKPKYYIPDVYKEKYHGAQTAKMLKGCEEIMIKEKPKITLVGGDANTNLAGALAARKLQIYVGHVEAGLRSFDWRMPEEHNRVIIDHISDFLFAPTEKAKENLIKDSVRGKIFVTGNPIVDAVKQNIIIALKKKKIITGLTGHVGPITGMVLRDELLYTGAQDGTVRIWNLDGKKAQESGDYLKKISDSDSWIVLASILSNPNVSGDVIDAVIKRRGLTHCYEYFQEIAARNPNLQNGTLEFILTDTTTEPRFKKPALKLAEERGI